MTLQEALEYKEQVGSGVGMYTKLLLVAIEPTNTCQLHCSVCWSQTPTMHPARPKGFMSQELLDKIVDELKQEFDYKKVTVGLSYGGEPTLHPRFPEMAKTCHDVGFKNLQLPTNGILLNKRMNQVLLDNFTELAISIHKSPHMSRVVEKVKQLHAQRGQKFTPSIRANLVIEEFTQNELNQLEQKLSGHVDALRCISYITEDMQTVCEHSPLWPLCASTYVYMGIMWNGDVLPCCHLLSPGHWSLGNVAKGTIRKVWLSPPYKALRQGRFGGTICERCQIRR
jgi:radical SAM protein with 4Fe4S-binding SPASM domain